MSLQGEGEATCSYSVAPVHPSLLYVASLTHPKSFSRTSLPPSLAHPSPLAPPRCSLRTFPSCHIWQVIHRLRELARLEATLLFTEASRQPDVALPLLSERISAAMIRVSDALSMQDRWDRWGAGSMDRWGAGSMG